MSVTNANAVHTIENQSWMDIQGNTITEGLTRIPLVLFKGYLFLVLVHHIGNLNNVTTVITKSVFDYSLSSDDYHVDMLASGANRIPSFDEMARGADVFHVESAPQRGGTLDMKVNNGNSKNCLFVESWIVDGALDDIEENEVLFEDKDVKCRFSLCALIADWSDWRERVCVFQADVSIYRISQWGTNNDMIHGGLKCRSMKS